MRAVIFANGTLPYPAIAQAALQPGDLLIAADGGFYHCRELGLAPTVVIGDFDSLADADVVEAQAAGAEIVRHPAHKDFTDLELALRYALEKGVDEILVLAALGGRWDQSLANLLLPAAADLASIRISLIDGPQEILLLRSGGRLEVRGRPGDTVSLIPLGGDARGITTLRLEYPLQKDTLYFGSTRGISNVLLANTASIALDEGLLLCVVVHKEGTRE
jgi:thiamine pyrophosphokinase